jgi:hypothetical protein
MHARRKKERPQDGRGGDEWIRAIRSLARHPHHHGKKRDAAGLERERTCDGLRKGIFSFHFSGVPRLWVRRIEREREREREECDICALKKRGLHSFFFSFFPFFSEGPESGVYFAPSFPFFLPIIFFFFSPDPRHETGEE